MPSDAKMCDTCLFDHERGDDVARSDSSGSENAFETTHLGERGLESGLRFSLKIREFLPHLFVQLTKSHTHTFPSAADRLRAGLRLERTLSNQDYDGPSVGRRVEEPKC